MYLRTFFSSIRFELRVMVVPILVTRVLHGSLKNKRLQNGRWVCVGKERCRTAEFEAGYNRKMKGMLKKGARGRGGKNEGI